MLSTIGYEGAQPHHFVATLQHAGVEILIDIRDRAQSRRKGFSKTALANLLAESGIDYLHFRALGDPREGRLAARAGDWERFRTIYGKVLKSADALRALSTIADIAGRRRACLMCYERDHKLCHRAIVAGVLSKQIATTTRHLGVEEIEPTHKSFGRVRHLDQGAAA